jgi:hypothetical protein
MVATLPHTFRPSVTLREPATLLALPVADFRNLSLELMDTAFAFPHFL